MTVIKLLVLLYCESRKSIGIHQVVWLFGSPNGVNISLKVH